MTIREHVELAPYTTFGIGGTARFFIEAASIDEVHEALAFAKDRGLSVFVLGGGSNILISDHGFDGVVLRVNLTGMVFHPAAPHVVTVGAGVPWDALVVATLERGLAGLECLSGVPGTVGGAVVANLGCYGAQMSDTFVSARVLDLVSGGTELQTLTREECQFSYHDSLFAKQPGRYVVLDATFELSTSGVVGSTYADHRFDLATMTAHYGHVPTLHEVRTAVLDVREEKGTLIMPGRTSYKCAGSFFHMPFVSPEHYQNVVQRARELDAAQEERLRPWAWMQSDGTYKLAPGFLLEYTDFQKGFVRGGVGISPRHTLSIINTGTATAAEVATLAHDMQQAVYTVFGVQLEREVEYVGDIENKK